MRLHGIQHLWATVRGYWHLNDPTQLTLGDYKSLAVARVSVGFAIHLWLGPGVGSTLPPKTWQTVGVPQSHVPLESGHGVRDGAG